MRNLMKSIFIFVLLFALSLASAFDEMKSIARNDQCAFERLETIKPKIQVQI